MSPILLVHGAWHGPWCWHDFARHLSEHGHDVHTVQLRGHDQRPGRIWYRLRDYVEDVQRAAAQFREPPIVVGHSLGGLLVQKHLQRHTAAGAVLMASIPPRGALPAAARIALRHPIVLLKATFLLSLRPFTGPANLVREMFFSPGTRQQVVDDCAARLQDDSYRMFLDVLRVTWRPPRAALPVLVLGAECDGFFTAREIEQTARAYGTKAQIFPGMGHDMMLEHGWQQVADRVDAWMREVEAGRGARQAAIA